jgi:hypothetical protein
VYASSARVHPVGVTPGIADLTCFASAWGFTFFHETKVKEKQSKAQWEFMQEATASGSPYVLGDVSSANAFLCWLGIATPLNETIRFAERHRWEGIISHRRLVHYDGDLARPWAESAPMTAALDRWGWSEPRPRAQRRARS